MEDKVPTEPMVEIKCNDCGTPTMVFKQYEKDPDQVCQKCYDNFNGMTAEELRSND